MIDITNYTVHDLYQAMNESADWTKDANVTAALYDLVESSVQDDIRESHRRLARLYQHLIKYCSQQTLQSGSWFGSIFEQRQRLKDLTSNTNVRISFTDDVLDSCYNQALIYAVAESGPIKRKEFYKRPLKWTLDFLLDDDNIKNLLIAYVYTEEAQKVIDDIYWNIPHKKGKKKKKKK